MRPNYKSSKNANVYTAIAFGVDLSTGEQVVVKYRNIGKAEPVRKRFERFLKGKFPGMGYVNYYDPITRKFSFRTDVSSIT